MILEADDAALFYRAWGALLYWVNEQRHVVPSFPRPVPGRPIEAGAVMPIRNAVWAEDGLRERFLAVAASGLGAAERALIASWRHRVSGRFVVHRHLAKHSIFIGDHVYAVHGIYTPLSVMLPDVPKYVEAVLLPFRDVIITDGMITSPTPIVSFGAGPRRMFADAYREARAGGELRGSLPWPAVTEPARIAATPSSAGRPVRPGTKKAPRQRASAPAVQLSLVEEPAGPTAAPQTGRPPAERAADAEPEMADLVDALGVDPRLVTLSACWGHGERPARIELAVEGMPGLRALVERLRRVERKLGRLARLDVTLNWSEQLPTACDFAAFPGWIMLALHVEAARASGAPSIALLGKVARLLLAAGSSSD